MKQLAKGTPFTLYYSPLERQSGLTTLLDAWDDSGVKLTDNLGADEELCSEAIYKYTYTTPNADCYLLIKVFDDFSESMSESYVFRVGSPADRKLFYYTKDETLTLEYEIFDSKGDVQQSGVMNHIVAGFYSVVVSGLSGYYYFKVDSVAQLVQF